MKKKITTQPKIMEISGLHKIVAKDSSRLYLFKDISFDIHLGQKIGLLGVNGVGKSTLMRVIAGKEHNFDGKIMKHYDHVPYGISTSDENLRIGYLEQEPNFNANDTIFDAVMEGMEFITTLQKRYSFVIEEMCDPLCDINTLMLEQDYIENRLDFLNGWNIDNQVIESCKALKCPDDLTRKCGTLSGGELRRVALAKLLLSRPDILLLDEPTNHLDITSVEWLETFVQNFGGVVMTVTHDRIFLESTSNTVMELDKSKLFTHYGLYTEWLRKRSTISFEEDKIQEKLKKTIDREHEILKKGQTLKGRINKIKEMEKQLAVCDGIIPFVGYEPSLLIPQGAVLKGKFILNVQDLTYVHPESGRCFFKKLTFSLSPGMVVGVVGPNGIGKTTLFKLIVGELAPSSGKIHIGGSVELGYIDQSRKDLNLNPNHTVWEEILDGHDMDEAIHINERKQMQPREYVKQFNFTGRSQDKLVSFLSGGERNRVHLAKSLRNGCNVLLLDEPSNDLDVDTVRKLEECMETFRGIAMVISHDRYFLDRVCTHLIAFDEQKVQWFEGNYSEYLKFKNQEKKLNKKKSSTASRPVSPNEVINGNHMHINGVKQYTEETETEIATETKIETDTDIHTTDTRQQFELVHAVVVERQGKELNSFE